MAEGAQPREHEIPIRVRYCETDAMGFLHHANFLIYFEMGRTELFRAQGGDYRKMEEGGHFFVVVEMNVKYRSPARFDDCSRCERGSSASRRPNSSTNTACSATPP